MAKLPKETAPETTSVMALLPIEVDGARHAPGDVVEIRAGLVADLVAAGAVQPVTDAPAE